MRARPSEGWMQIPTTIDGLKQALKALGYPSLLDGADLSRPDICDEIVSQLAYEQQRADPGALDYNHTKAVALLRRFPWSSGVSDQTQKALAAARAALLEAGDLIRFPTERVRKVGLPPVKDGPPAKVMEIKKVNAPAQEVTIAPKEEPKPAEKPEYRGPSYERKKGERYHPDLDVKEIAKTVRTELNDLAKKNKIPKFKYSVRLQRYSGGQSINVHIASGKDSIAGMFNLPVLLTSMLQGYGHLPSGEKFELEKPALKELQKLIQKKLDDFNYDASDTMSDYFDVNFYAHVTVDWQAKKAIEEELRGAYLRIKGDDKPLFDYKTFQQNPGGAVDAYRDILKQAGYTDRQLSASKLGVIAAKPNGNERQGLVQKYAEMFYSALMGAPPEIQQGNQKAYLAHLKDMQAKYPTVDLETPEFEQALHNEAEQWWKTQPKRL